MKLHTVFISYDRVHLTKRAVDSYLWTVSLPNEVWIVDNNSTPDTKMVLESLYKDVCGLLWLEKNLYPGYACNRGWEFASEDVDFLHRADNDFAFLPGWCEEVERIFEDPTVGQVGLRTNEEEMNAKHNVGGNCVIRRELWDRGLRYDERPWSRYAPGYSEDSYFSPAVKRMGYRWARVEKPCIESLASGDLDDPYYQRSYGVRRII